VPSPFPRRSKDYSSGANFTFDFRAQFAIVDLCNQPRVTPELQLRL